MTIGYIKSGTVGLALMMLLGSTALGATYVEDMMDNAANWDLVAEPGGGPSTGGETVVGGTGLGATVVNPAAFRFDRYSSSTYGENWADVGGIVEAPVIRADFQFWTGGGTTQFYPSALTFFIQDTGGDEWYYDFSGQLSGLTANSWNDLSFNMWGNGWTQAGGASFAAVKADVVEYGWIFGYHAQDNGTETYGFDNFQLHYPEPGTYAVLAFALMSLGVTFRGKLQSGLKGLLKK